MKLAGRREKYLDLLQTSSGGFVSNHHQFTLGSKSSFSIFVSTEDTPTFVVYVSKRRTAAIDAKRTPYFGVYFMVTTLAVWIVAEPVCILFFFGYEVIFHHHFSSLY